MLPSIEFLQTTAIRLSAAAVLIRDSITAAKAEGLKDAEKQLTELYEQAELLCGRVVFTEQLVHGMLQAESEGGEGDGHGEA